MSVALSTPGGASYQGFASRESAHVPQLLITMSTSAPTPPPRPLPPRPARTVCRRPDRTVGGRSAAVTSSTMSVLPPRRSGRSTTRPGMPARAVAHRTPSASTGNLSRSWVNEQGTTGGMSAKFERRKYGRWEVRMRTSARDPEYHPVLILWPDSQNWPCDGEVDFSEGTEDPSTIHFFHHYGCSNRQTSAARNARRHPVAQLRGRVDALRNRRLHRWQGMVSGHRPGPPAARADASDSAAGLVS